MVPSWYIVSGRLIGPIHFFMLNWLYFRWVPTGSAILWLVLKTLSWFYFFHVIDNDPEGRWCISNRFWRILNNLVLILQRRVNTFDNSVYGWPSRISLMFIHSLKLSIFNDGVNNCFALVLYVVWRLLHDIFQRPGNVSLLVFGIYWRAFPV